VVLDRERAAEAREQYALEYDRYSKLARLVSGVCKDLVERAGIQAAVQNRAKDPASFYRKLVGYVEDENASKIEQVETARDALDMVGDLAAVRVATYVEADRGRVVELITNRFRGPLGDGSVEVDHKTKETGYRATHCQVLLPDDLLTSPDNANIRDTSAEVQVCSMLAHVWNEIEHDIRYKVVVDWADEVALRDLTLQKLRDATDQGDEHIEALLGLQSEKIAMSICADVGEKFEGVGSFGANGVAVLTEVVRLGYSSLEQIDGAFLAEGSIARGRELIGRINVALKVEGVDDPELELDPNNADVLLALLLYRHWADLVALYERRLRNNDALRAARIAQAIKDTQALPTPGN
jgi:ppGpp synthetase/RelA/SpoT-type nucleotidyltranferase